MVAAVSLLSATHGASLTRPHGGSRMLKAVRKSLRDEKGQGMTEYIIMVILIALAVLIFTRFLGTKVGSQTSAAGSKIGSLTIPP